MAHKMPAISAQDLRDRAAPETLLDWWVTRYGEEPVDITRGFCIENSTMIPWPWMATAFLTVEGQERFGVAYRALMRTGHVGVLLSDHMAVQFGSQYGISEPQCLDVIANTTNVSRIGTPHAGIALAQMEWQIGTVMPAGLVARIEQEVARQMLAKGYVQGRATVLVTIFAGEADSHE